VNLVTESNSDIVEEEDFREMANLLKIDILGCDNILSFNFDCDIRLISRIENVITIAKRLFLIDARILEIISQWNYLPNFRIRSDALRMIDAMLSLSSRNLFLEWGKLVQKN
jgi:hypothetical protein